MAQDDLDDLFAAARSRPLVPSEALMARVLADAMAEQPKAAAVRAAVAPARRGGWFAGFAEVFGGFGALAGVGGAAVAGLVLGFVQPATVTDFADSLLGAEVTSVTLIPSADALMVEE
ncbi:dihydroorotate dehydrogenase [Paragemmobacter straminiformis]|uniref:Dihydroorotate dehydrogenase n=1 Tax=Paragemmobacter straminiformis TaxID=2045119 RepID=A0A842ICE0_9RHOB|nr:dihydroorotate dehydrogenase [Gemmobacter straminiformis]MBC2837093.1 dihydroorotate dehydrogenase [Gemmobacter straminiformis]